MVRTQRQKQMNMTLSKNSKDLISGMLEKNGFAGYVN
jgi:hypothetical protein